MDKQALFSVLEDLAPPELINGVECAQSTKELLPLLDAELQRSSTRLQRIQEYRNKLSSPMYTLLPELLSKIFIIYATDENELFNMRWARLLLVCRRWYDVGVSTPMLWSYISLNESSSIGAYHTISGRASKADSRLIKRIEAQLARAGGSPLAIKSHMSIRIGDIPEDLRPYYSVWWDSNVLKSLSLSGEQERMASLLRVMASHRHPILTSLNLGVTPPGFRSFITTGNPPPATSTASAVVLPDSLLGDGAPRLSSLTLNGIQPNWTRIRNLRVLHATLDVNAVDISTMSSENIAGALGRCPLLEDLRITLPRNIVTSDMNPSTPIVLNGLRTAIIRGPADVCTTLLHSFEDLPPSSRISLSLSGKSSLEQISRSSSILGTHVGQNDASIIRSVSITMSSALVHLGTNLDMLQGHLQAGQLGAGHHGVQLCVSGSTYLDRHPPVDLPFSMTLAEGIYTSLTVIPDNETTVEIALGQILQSWKVKDTTSIDARACRTLSATIWRTLLNDVPSATTVVVLADSISLTSLLEVLNSSSRTGTRRIIRNIILDLSDVGRNTRGPFLFGAAGNAINESTSPLAELNIIRVLRYCAEAAQAGVPLDTIELVNDHMQTQAAKRIIQVRPEMDWSELYRDLSEGFIYEGMLHSSTTGPDGVERDSFSGPKIAMDNMETQVILRGLFS